MIMMSSTLSIGGEKCKVNSDGSVNLGDILKSFNSGIREEHAWALCYQCSCFISAVITSNPLQDCRIPSDIEHIYLQTDGGIHSKTLFGNENCRKKPDEEKDLISGLGMAIFQALDNGNDNRHERIIDSELEQLISDMLHDDKNIQQENAKDEMSNRNDINLIKVMSRCEMRIPTLTKQQVEAHYKAVVRALVAEALELSTFLERVSCGQVSNSELVHLEFSDWARFWMQVMSELRTGVKLKKVHYSKAPIEYELTPYEILMKDIRSCRYNLRKVMINGDVPHKVTKDAHDIILEFIRSRPPLKKASDRKLAPLPKPNLTLREQLMNSIRKGRRLRPVKNATSNRRVIKVDFSQLLDDDDDVEDDDEEEDDVVIEEGAPGLWALEENRQANEIVELEPYDLATAGVSSNIIYKKKKEKMKTFDDGSRSVPQSRPGSRQSYDSVEYSLDNDKTSSLLLEENLESLENRLSLTLHEIVHIRKVLTKAELEALPHEGRVRADVESRKVCFLCLKTRFGIFGPRGLRCALCKRTICARCSSKMYIPMEHFNTVPVVLLSPQMLLTPEEEDAMSESTNSYKSVSSKSPSNKPSSSVCHDCRMMIKKIAETAKINMTAVRDRTLQNLTLNLSPVF